MENDESNDEAAQKAAGGSGPALLHALISSRPQLHLFATNAEGLTALGAARRGSQCGALLLAATQRALEHAVVNIVFYKRESRIYLSLAQALLTELESTFPGLRVQIRPLVDMDDGEEGCPGSFEVLWEAVEWRHSRVLYSKLASGSTPSPSELIRELLRHLLGNGIPSSVLREWQPWLIRALRAMHVHLKGKDAEPSPPAREPTLEWSIPQGAPGETSVFRKTKKLPSATSLPELQPPRTRGRNEALRAPVQLKPLPGPDEAKPS